jgi:hypothetical protein
MGISWTENRHFCDLSAAESASSVCRLNRETAEKRIEKKRAGGTPLRSVKTYLCVRLLSIPWKWKSLVRKM